MNEFMNSRKVKKKKMIAKNLKNELKKTEKKASKCRKEDIFKKIK